MENAIELKNIIVSKERAPLKYIKHFAKRFFFHYGNFWNSQVDYEHVDKMIQETRLKYEYLRMRL